MSTSHGMCTRNQPVTKEQAASLQTQIYLQFTSRPVLIILPYQVFAMSSLKSGV
jgi:hypothetical protein